MTLNQAVGLLVGLTALFAYVNARFVHLPGAIGVMLLALVASLALLLLTKVGVPFAWIPRSKCSARSTSTKR